MLILQAGGIIKGHSADFKLADRGRIGANACQLNSYVHRHHSEPLLNRPAGKVPHMTSAVLRVVIVVSLAHAMVHVFEQSVASVEQIVADEYQVGTDRSGLLGTAFRLPFGLLALVAGYWADRLGTRRMLILFLIGCAGASLAMLPVRSLPGIHVNLLVMGCFASIYHPAGLALIANRVSPEKRGLALGIHGVLGSTGIAGAPFIAAVVFGFGTVSWRQYYGLLAIPAVLIAGLIAALIRDRRRLPPQTAADLRFNTDRMQWRPYLLVVCAGGLSGVVYGGFLHFLPRYLDSAGVLAGWDLSAESARNYLSAGALACGAVGQFTAGWFARPERLERMTLGILVVSVPLLTGMAFASGSMRFVLVCAFAVVHFMNQPVINSLLPQFVPTSRASTGFGFSNMVGFSCSAAGPAIAGLMTSDQTRYLLLAAVGLGAVVIAFPLLFRDREAVPKRSPATEDADS